MKNKEKITGLVIVIIALVALVGSIVRFSLMERLPIKKGEAIQEEVVEEQAKINNLMRQLIDEEFLGGVGIAIKIKQGYPIIIRVLDSTPAEKAGLKAGDRIIKIQGESTKDMPLSEVVKKSWGPIDSVVNLTVLRNGKKEPLEFSIKRELIKVKSE